MAYSIPTPSQLVYFTENYADYIPFVNRLINARSNSFQTQSGRDELREILIKSQVSVVSPISRFPAEPAYYIYLRDPSISTVYTALLQSTDTRNRVIEVENSTNVTTAEQLNAVRRTDDASTAIHNNLEQLLSLLTNGTGVFNRTSFESASGLTWLVTTTPRTA
uniref:Capsid protein n=2 Tax=Sunn-hemp mosaic virus TaxID=12240 RepID=CAPSD_SHMV|nr:RecName: Full=Capsid protein; AltName: Full=Coat protein [Sunn-hemp mosaic virus]